MSLASNPSHLNNMEVVVRSPNGSPTLDPFDFNRARISPYLSAPSSPKRFGEYYYLSAPTSPSRLFSEEIDYFSSASPFEPSTPNPNGDDGFAFFVNEETEKSSRSAEELFDGGKIKPLKEDELIESAKSPLLSGARPKPSSPIAQGKKIIREALSPRKKKESKDEGLGEERRGRDRNSSSNSVHRVTRSLSPYRMSHYTWDEEESYESQNNKEESVTVPTATVSSLASTSSSKSSRKWRLRDFLLFRSASEGRGSSKDPFRKLNVLYKKPEEGKGSSTPARGPEIPRVRRKEGVSAHELHYARKKAESEDLKKRTFLPYKQGILGRLAGFGR